MPLDHGTEKLDAILEVEAFGIAPRQKELGFELQDPVDDLPVPEGEPGRDAPEPLGDDDLAIGGHEQKAVRRQPSISAAPAALQSAASRVPLDTPSSVLAAESRRRARS